MSEEERAAAYWQQAETRKAFRTVMQRRLAGDEPAAQQVRENYQPLLEATRHGERDAEEKRPDGVANG